MNQTEINKEKALVYLKALSYNTPSLTLPFDIDNKLSELVLRASKILNKKSTDEKVENLRSVFSIVLQNFENAFVSQTKLSIEDDSIFPKEKKKIKKDNCLEQLHQEVKKINTQSPKVFAENLLFLLQTYTSNLPEPSGCYPGVSFYDYAKILSALSLCLYENPNDNEPCILVRADVSGIQDYIFNIASKHAARNLKGRSFYLRLLTDTILYKILWELDICHCNVLFSSGGNFMLLLPKSKKEQFEKLTYEIDEKLFNEHKTNISLVFGQISLGLDDLSGENLKTKIDELFIIVDRKKKQKFATGLSQNFEGFFSPGTVEDKGGSTRRDVITGEEFDWDELVFWDEGGVWQSILAGKISDDDEKDYFNKISKKQIELGKQLKDVKYWLITSQKLDGAREEESYVPCEMGVYHYLISEKEHYKKFLSSKDCLILQFNNPNYFIKGCFLGQDNIYGFTFYGGNAVPTFEMKYEETDENGQKVHHEIGEQKTFNHLAFRLKPDENDGLSAAKSGKLSRLGILRMDVDGLGWIFSEGLTSNNYQNYNLLTYTTLSRNLDIFFMGYLNTIWEKEGWEPGFKNEKNIPEKIRHYTQIIYSGGDDLFIVGRWDACIYFAKKIKDRFLEFTGQNLPDVHPKLSISGGLSIVTHKFPIIKGAEFAGEAEKAAKNYKAGDTEKNAFTLWRPLHWDWEMEKVNDLKNKVLSFMSSGKKDEYKTVFQRLLRYYELKQQLEGNFSKQRSKQNNPSIHRFRWIWLLVYNLSRVIEQYKKDDEFCDFLEQIKTDVFTNAFEGNKERIKGKYEFFDLLQIAIRWADLEYRTISNN